jgi:hypothetical protein
MVLESWPVDDYSHPLVQYGNQLSNTISSVYSNNLQYDLIIPWLSSATSCLACRNVVEAN